MQIGDPKKTVVLAVIAVAAIGFCFKQLTGGGDAPKALRGSEGSAAGDASGAATPSGTLAVLTLDQLRNDAFSHPRLATKLTSGPTGPIGPQNPSTDPGQAGSGAGPKGTALPGPFANGGIDKHPGDDWPVPVNAGSLGLKPDGPGSGGVQVVKVTQISLKAIVKVSQRMAYLSIDGQEARGYRAGDLIKDDIQVAFVNDDSVIVKSGTKTVTLKVGQQGDL